MDVILYNDPSGNVVAYTPPGGMTAQDAQALCPQPSFIVDNATLPNAPMQAWRLAADGTLMVDQATVTALSIPQSVTNAQLKRQLDVMGKLGASQAAVTQAGGLTMELWYGAGEFHRTDPLLTAMATAIGMTSSDVDAAFIAAVKL
jgi:hypothetical protein